MAIPFSTLKPVEEVVIGGIPMKKRGCLTVAEMQAAADIEAQTKEQLPNLSPAQADVMLKQHIATILIRSRVDRNWTLEQTQQPDWDVVIDGKVTTIEPDMDMLDELFTFFLNEQRRWKTETETEAEPAKKPTGRKSTGG